MKRTVASGLFSKLDIIFCVFLAENNFVNAFIPFSGTYPVYRGYEVVNGLAKFSHVC